MRPTERASERTKSDLASESGAEVELSRKVEAPVRIRPGPGHSKKGGHTTSNGAYSVQQYLEFNCIQALTLW